ncbi:MalY/PatB family protein [uncultured Cellulomonas sp.]|uniref:MalY/PatB family protein n=1 Tax=uncultured Cellulomonas sp. TaxID=189682 RepID=UPI002603FCD1|nr:aminotransferase class I/II-fold pyridoxal phosphate-dependent enzyme [uncultured Cellulomonas sp.]
MTSDPVPPPDATGSLVRPLVRGPEPDLDPVGEEQLDAITADALRAAGSLKWSTPDTLGAFVAEMDFPAAEPVVRALHAAVAEGAFGYLPPAAWTNLAEAAATWHRDSYGWDVPPEAVHALPDVLAGFMVAVEHFSRAGSPVVLPTPAYMPFLTVPATLGREVVEVPAVEVGGVRTLDLEAIDRALAPAGGLVVLCNPHNPLGRVLRREELLALCEVVERRGGRVFSDEIHAPLVYPGALHVPYASISPEAAAHTVTATSASKAWNIPGLKCAQMILSNPADAAVWQRIGDLAGHGTSTLGVVAATAAYRLGRPWLDSVLGYLDGTRFLLADLLAEHLPEVRYTPPHGTYLAWLDCRALDLPTSPGVFFRQQAGVALTDGAACGRAGEGFARYTFATPRPLVVQAVEAMGQAVRRR